MNALIIISALLAVVCADDDYFGGYGRGRLGFNRGFGFFGRGYGGRGYGGRDYGLGYRGDYRGDYRGYGDYDGHNFYDFKGPYMGRYSGKYFLSPTKRCHSITFKVNTELRLSQCSNYCNCTIPDKLSARG